MPEIKLTKSERIVRSFIQHYNEKKYWDYRRDVIENRGGGLRRILLKRKLLYIKKCDAFNNASFGTHLGFGAEFKSVPRLPHGLYGIIISHNVIVGNNAVIFHNVTIGEGKDGAPIIGDNVYIGTGAILIGNIRIGNNVKIGAGCVVTHDIPDNCTVVMQAPRVIARGE